MYFILSAAVFLIVASIMYRLFSWSNEPNFELLPQVSDTQALIMVKELAQNSQKTAPNGKGLSGQLIKKYAHVAYRRLRGGTLNLDFQIRLIENLHTLLQSVKRGGRKLKQTHFLPHINGLPRIYKLCSLIVKLNQGVASEQTIESHISAFNSITPLTHAEIEAIPTVLSYCLGEFLTIYCSKAVVIDKARCAAQNDVKKGRIDLNRLNRSSYIYYFSEFACGELAASFNSLCEKNDVSIADKSQGFIQMVSKYSSAVEAAFKSLSDLDAVLTDEFLLKLNPLNEFLEGENVVYKSCTLATKNVYLFHAAKRAKKEKQGELYFLRRVVDACEREKTDLASKLLPKGGSKSLMRAYIALVLVLSLAVCAIPIILFKLEGIVLGVLLFPSAVSIILLIISDLNAKIAFRRFLPRIKIDDSTEVKSLLTYCGLIANKDDIDELFFNMLALRYSNPFLGFRYALLLDLPKGEQFQQNDEELIDYLKEKFATLNEDRFNIFVRNRKKFEGGYQGWEKKRGALLELNEYLLFDNCDGFRLILGQKPQTKYVITLDSDTQLNSALELVEIMEHPYNKNKCVVSIGAKTNPYSVKTLFSRFSESELGLNGYSSPNSSVNYDLFDAGNYTGKGIYRLKEFHEKLKDFFPDNRVLSHDFIEGAIAGCGEGEFMTESCPVSFSQSLSRSIRWIRGDWQLLPYLFKGIKNRNCEKCINPITPIDKWHIFCNMLFSLLPVFVLISLVYSVFVKFSPFALIISLSFYLVCLLNAFRSFALHRRSPLMQIARVLFSVACLPLTAVYNFGAIIVTIVRLITKKRLLEWKIFKSSAQKINFMPSVLFGLGFIAAGYFINLSFYALGGLFLICPFAIKVLNLEFRCKKAIDESDANMLKDLAKRTWEYFEALNQDGLPSDNFQEHLDIGFANRTSPTNLGFDLLSVFCAFKLGFIDLNRAQIMLMQKIDKIVRLEKWKGNLFNWFDLNGRVLYPKYVSSVDNGNLLACLMCVFELSDNQTKVKIQKLIDDMDLSALYDKKRGLMHIGYNQTESIYEGHYDLLASESMLTYLIGIALGKIPKTAFYNLNRVSIRAFNRLMLCSWGGGLFEYLMNCIFIDYPRHSMLNRSAKNCITAHIKGDKSYFWGVSESQYNQTDSEGNYQYKSFGLDKIALSTYATSSVKAPYASILALNYNPRAVIKNILKMKRAGAYGKLGLYESVDNGVVIKTYMTHHQGMIIGSICNLLCSGAVKDALIAYPQIEAAKLLLTQSCFDATIKKPKAYAFKSSQKNNESCFAPATNPERFNFLTNGRYFLTTGSCGSLTSNFFELCVSRNDGFKKGFRIFVNGFDPLTLGAQFNSYKSVYGGIFDEIRTEISAMTMYNFDGEMRHVEIKNLGKETREIEILTYFEPALSKQADDLSHKIFSSFKIRTFIKEGILFAHRTNLNRQLYLGHFLSGKGCEYESNRHNLRFLSRLPSFGSPIYPALSAKRKITLKPNEKYEFNAFIVLSDSVEGVINAQKIASIGSYYSQNLAACLSYSRHLGTSRRIADIASALMAAKSVDFPPLKRLPVVLYEHKEGVEHLKLVLTDLSRVSRFMPFNTVIAYTESDTYFKKTFNEISHAARELKNLFFYNRVYEQGKIDLISPLAVNYNNPIHFKQDVVKAQPMTPYLNALIEPPSLDLDLGGCGFLPDSSFIILPNAAVERPWCNVIANGILGTIISHNGSGYSYLKNSHMLKLSEHSNDPIDDNISEGIIFYERGIEWSASIKPFKHECDYFVCHGFGFSEFKCNFNGAISKLTQFCSFDSKFYAAEIENKTAHVRKIEASFFINLILGDYRENSGGFIEIDTQDDYIEAKNTLNGQHIRIYCSKPIIKVQKNNPRGIKGVLIAPCLQINVELDLKPNSSDIVIFKLGESESQIPLEVEAQTTLKKSKQYFSNLSALKIETDDKKLNHLLNWLPYQVLCSRFNARAGFYQAGGAIGFRDQLQDCLSLLYVDPLKVRSHILNCAAHQFIEGDVQHWWHPPYSGVRTKINDDLLYLPLLTAEYIAFSGDKSILSVTVPYLKGRLLNENEKDAYFSPSPDISAPLFDHCIKALLYNTLNDDGLVLMLGGDWNDALDNVGLKGKGVSVFTTIFLYYVINRFLPFVENGDLRATLLKRAERLKIAANNAHDGEWFLRLITDDGLILGSKQSKECKIDLLCQSWAALSGITDTKRAKTALKAVAEHLIDYENGIIKLLDPPFESIDAGYISKYPKGIRENGGQYTHAAVWYIMALLNEGQNEFAYSLLDMLNPISQRLSNKKYLAEPYVLCGDVYSGEYSGVSGWSWYTGAASWYYKCVIENILGLIKRGNTLYFSPNLPSKMNNISINYKCEFGSLAIKIDNSTKNGQYCLYVNKIKYNDCCITLSPSLIGKTILLKRES